MNSRRYLATVGGTKTLLTSCSLGWGFEAQTNDTNYTLNPGNLGRIASPQMAAQHQILP